MKFSSQYQKRQPVPNQATRKAKKKLNPATLTVIIALVLAVVCIGTALIVHALRQKQKEQPNFVPQDTVSTTAADPTTTEAQPTTDPANTTTETQTKKPVGDLKYTTHPYKLNMYSTATTLNIRSAPSADSQKIGMVGQDVPVQVVGHTDNGWYQVEVKGTKGFVSDKYLVEAPQLKAHSKSPYYIKVNRKQNIVIVFERNELGEYQKPVKSFVCSVGKDGKTPLGTFVCSDHYNWRLLSGNVYGQYAVRIDGHYLFHSVPYFKQAKDTLEYEEYNKLGSPASLGCIRLSVEDAKWIHDNCPAGTVVTIYDSDEKEPLPKPTPIRIDVNDEAKRGWDPTDPDKNNPWK